MISRYPMNFRIETNTPSQNDILKIEIYGSKKYISKCLLLSCSIVGVLNNKNSEIVFLKSIPVVLTTKDKKTNSILKNKIMDKSFNMNEITEIESGIEKIADHEKLFQIQMYLEDRILPTYRSENYSIEYHVLLNVFPTPKESMVFRKEFIVRNLDYLYSEYKEMLIVDQKHIHIGEGNENFHNFLFLEFQKLIEKCDFSAEKILIKNTEEVKDQYNDFFDGSVNSKLIRSKSKRNIEKSYNTNIEFFNEHQSKMENIRYLERIENIFTKENFEQKIADIYNLCSKKHYNNLKKYIKPSINFRKTSRKFNVTLEDEKIAEMLIDDILFLDYNNLIKLDFHKNIKKLKIKIVHLEKEVNFKLEFENTIYKNEYNVEYCNEKSVTIYLKNTGIYSLHTFYFLSSFTITFNFDGQNIEIPIQIMEKSNK